MEERPGDDRPQLPPPSLWPVGFAVGVVCLLVGLVVSWWVAAAGAALALIFGFLWVRDVVSGRERATGPSSDEPATDGAPAIPEHEAERFPRSKFLEGATLGLGALIGALVTLPVVAAALVPGFVKQKSKPVNLGPLANFKEGQYYVATFERNQKEGYISRMSAFIRNYGSTNG